MTNTVRAPKVTPDAWVQVAGAGTSSCFVERGGEVSFTQASEAPTTSIVDTPCIDRKKVGESCVFFNVPVAIYARAHNKDSDVTYSPTAE
jgi:hypothetical protein